MFMSHKADVVLKQSPRAVVDRIGIMWQKDFKFISVMGVEHFQGIALVRVPIFSVNRIKRLNEE